MSSENSGSKQEPGKGSRFRKGQSGNPAGKPRGARHATTIMAERLLADDAEAVVRAVLDKARQGDMIAARLVLERLVPPRRDRAVSFDLPALETAADIARAGRAVMAQVAASEITPAEAADVMKLLEGLARAIEVSDLEQRLKVLEEGLKQ